MELRPSLRVPHQQCPCTRHQSKDRFPGAKRYHCSVYGIRAAESSRRGYMGTVRKVRRSQVKIMRRAAAGAGAELRYNWGPPLWTVFFEDARVPVNQAGFSEALFADDLNAYKSYNQSCQNEQTKMKPDRTIPSRAGLKK